MKRNGFHRANVAAAFLLCLILLAASGVWNATYCCDRCAQRGIAVFMTGRCGEGEQKSCCGTQLSGEENSGSGRTETCRFEWRKAPVDFFSPVAANFQFIPIDWMSVCRAVAGLYLWPVPEEDIFVGASDPPPLEGRRILERHAVFLI